MFSGILFSIVAIFIDFLLFNVANINKVMKNTKLIFKLNGKLYRAISSGNRFLPDVAFNFGCCNVLFLCVGKVGSHIINAVNYCKLAGVITFETCKRMARRFGTLAIYIATNVCFAVNDFDVITRRRQFVENNTTDYFIAPNAKFRAEPSCKVKCYMPIRSPSALF